ncbi:MAG: tRNA (adenosine(37)-N6)-dimethylallyltransferase MiaA [Bacteroidales bacterium]|jgi:tRNA dimethylallyltransferase|nr:tRNA (adenosine(37)-N6)-dimethylallyltransferase MiaA [Bacteroidales bacterium]
MEHLITILGATATGKTRLAVELASLIDGEIISADSRQVYKGMDIGTGKDIEEYTFDGKTVPYHLIDIVEPGYEFNVFEFHREFHVAYKDVVSRGKMPVMCGGSGMYLDAVISGYKFNKVPLNEFLRKNLEDLSDDELVKKLKSYGPLHNITDISDRHRLVRAIEIAEFEKKNEALPNELPTIHSLNFGIRFERETIRRRVTERLEYRLENGLIEEVRDLLDGGLKAEQLMFYGLEYKYVTLLITGQMEYDEMFTLLNTAIHQYAKKQMTWYRKMEKKGVKIHWIDGNINLDNKIAVVLGILRHYQS